MPARRGAATIELHFGELNNMVKKYKAEFDAGAYWRNRVVSGSDLGVVGHRSMGLVYSA